MNRWALAWLAALGLLSIGASWSAGTFETQPVGPSDLVSEGDDRIRELKAQIRKREQVEHHFGDSAGSLDNGLHLLGSARCFQQNTAPTALVVSGGYDQSADSFVAPNLSTTEPDGTDDQGKGRCWVDLDGPDGVAGTLDDNSFAVWNETSNSWTYIYSAGNNPSPTNLLSDAGFQATDGTGSLASTTVPQGWAAQNTPSFAYASRGAADAEGVGVTLTVTAGAGDVDEGISQTVAGLKSSTQYYVVARVQPAVALDSCSLRVTGGGTTSFTTSTIATGTAWTTLSGILTTDAAGADPTVIVEADGNSDACRIAFAGLFEISQTIAKPPPAVVCIQTDTTNTENYYSGGAFAAVTNSCTVTVPPGAWNIEVNGAAQVDSDSGSPQGFEVRIQENGATVAMNMVNEAANQTGAGQTADQSTGLIHYLKRSAAPGSTFVYTFEGRCQNACDRNEGTNAANDDTADSFEAQPTSRLEVELRRAD